jgi:hypothetical protein
MADDAQAQLDGFLEKYAPDTAVLARQALERMRARLPGAVQMVYDNYQFLAIGFGPSERASEAVFSIAVAPKKVNLCFLWGASLADPSGRLKGGGNRVRNLQIAGPETFGDPEVQALMAEAMAARGAEMDDPANGKLVIKSISAKQRPRR